MKLFYTIRINSPYINKTLYTLIDSSDNLSYLHLPFTLKQNSLTNYVWAVTKELSRKKGREKRERGLSQTRQSRRSNKLLL